MAAATEMRIDAIASGLSAELGAVRDLLTAYEGVVARVFDDGIAADEMSRVQGFDLALQVITDLQTVLDHLAQHTPHDLRALHMLPAQALKLERCRDRFAAGESRHVAQEPGVHTPEIFSFTYNAAR